MNRIEDDHFKENWNTRSHSDTFWFIFDQILDHNFCNCNWIQLQSVRDPLLNWPCSWWPRYGIGRGGGLHPSWWWLGSILWWLCHDWCFGHLVMPTGTFTILINVNEPDGKDKSYKETREVERFEVYVKYTELHNLLTTVATHTKSLIFWSIWKKFGFRQIPEKTVPSTSTTERFHKTDTDPLSILATIFSLIHRFKDPGLEVSSFRVVLTLFWGKWSHSLSEEISHIMY